MNFHQQVENIIHSAGIIVEDAQGSTADKIAMFYLKLQDSIYDLVIIVADTTTVDAFEPLIRFFRNRRMTLDNVQVMTLEQFQEFINRRETI